MSGRDGALLRTRVLLSSVFSSLLVTLMFVGAVRLFMGNNLPSDMQVKFYVHFAALGVCSLGLTAVIMFWGTRHPTKLLAEIETAVSGMAEGHLKVFRNRVAGELFGNVSQYLTRMSTALNSTMNGAIAFSNRLFTSGANLNGNAERLTANVHLQTERACQIASAAEEMAQSIDDIANKAVSASKTSHGAIAIVSESQSTAAEAIKMTSNVLESTNRLSATIEKLNSSILAIDGFVTLIEDIADQTNLLALNAAIEAARSGEYGRGFAVVAEEVRNLASKTIQVTSEISSTIKEIQADSLKTTAAMQGTAVDVTSTADCIHKVGSSLNQISEAFHHVNDQIAQIASAVEQQSATTQEVASNIEQTSQLSREMGKMADEVGHEVQSLSSITDGLLGILGKMRLEAHFRAEAMVESISKNPGILSMERTRQENEMRSIARSFPYIELLYVTGTEGRQITSNISAGNSVCAAYGTDGYGMDWSGRPWFRGARDSKSCYISDLYLSSATGHFCLTISAPLLDSQNRLKGVLGVDVDFEQLCQAERL